jgi:hypothetical protein
MGRPISSSPPETIAVSADSTESMRLDTRERGPDRGGDARAVHRRDDQPVGRAEAVGLREDLGRARDVEQLHTVEDDHHDDALHDHAKHDMSVSVA